ncbi:MAG: hypothetical protein ACREB8_12590 [Pseudolabrys sp.]
MSFKIVNAMAAVTVLVLAGTQPAPADSLKCSDEQKACITICQKNPRALVGDCIANCRTRTNFCKKTGCWDNGIKRYCGLLRQ